MIDATAAAEGIGTEFIPTANSPEADSETEQILAAAITDLWSFHVQAQTIARKTNEELKAIRRNLGERLHAMKRLLARPGRAGQWTSFLNQHGIPRTTADRLVSSHAKSLAPDTNSTAGEIREPSDVEISKLFTAIWPRCEKVLTTPKSQYDLLRCFISRSGLAHEWQDHYIIVCEPGYQPVQDSEQHAGDTISHGPSDDGDVL